MINGIIQIVIDEKDLCTKKGTEPFALKNSKNTYVWLAEQIGFALIHINDLAGIVIKTGNDSICVSAGLVKTSNPWITVGIF